MQTMMQDIQLKYSAALQLTHQDYGDRGYYGGQNNFWIQVRCGAQRQVNFRCGWGGWVSSHLTHYCWTRGMCVHPINDFRTPTEFHKMNAFWCNKMLGREHRCTWQLGSLPSSKPNLVLNKTSYTSELLCSSTVDPPQHATITSKAYSGVYNNYWCAEDQLVITYIKDTHNGTTVQLANNYTMNATKTGKIPLAGSLRIYAKKAYFFMGCTVPRLSP